MRSLPSIRSRSILGIGLGMVLLSISALAFGATGPRRTAPSTAPSTSTAGAGQVWRLTYLKAHPGEVERLAAFIRQNWFVMDSAARVDGRIVDYQLLRAAPADTQWDLVEVAVFADSLQDAQADSIYATVYRPRHRSTRIDGKALGELGRIVSTTRTVWVGGRR